MKPISVVIIAKNESANIKRCIESCQNVSDDIIVMDTGSSDETIKISTDLGAIVHKSDWLGYGQTKNKANQVAKHNWILSLDADECLSKTLTNSILNTDFQSNTVYCLNRITCIGTQWIKHSGWHPQYLPRIFEKDKILWNSDSVHERLIIPDNFDQIKMNGLLLHYSFKNVADLRQRLAHYSKLKAEQWIKTGTRLPLYKIYFGPVARFIAAYFLKLGILDGKAGFIIGREEAKMIKSALKHCKRRNE